MLTAKEFAEETGISYPVVIVWLRDGKIPEAEQTSFKIWQIPANVAEAFKRPEKRPKRGRPRKPADEAKDQAGKEAAPVKETPAKPGKSRATKRAAGKTVASTRIAKKLIKK